MRDPEVLLAESASLRVLVRLVQKSLALRCALLRNPPPLSTSPLAQKISTARSLNIFTSITFATTHVGTRLTTSDIRGADQGCELAGRQAAAE